MCVTNSAARSVSAVISATSWTSVNSAICCGEPSRAISCWVVIASKWLRRNPSTPLAVGPIAMRTSGISLTDRSNASVSTATVPGTQTHRVAVLASTLSGLAPPAACAKRLGRPVEPGQVGLSGRRSR